MGPQLGRSKCGLQAILEAREMVFQQHFLYFHFQSRRIFALIGYYVHTSLLIILSNVSSLTSLTKAKHVMFFCLVFSVLYERSRSPLFCFFVLPDNHMLWWLDEWSDHHETIRSSFYTQLSMEEEEVKFGNIQIPLGYYRGTIVNGSKLEAMIGFPPPYYRNKTRWSSEYELLRSSFLHLWLLGCWV